MKKLVLTIALVGAVTAAFAQGTVQFSNGTLSRLSLITPGVSTVQIPVTASINIGLFYGIGQSTSLTFLTSQLGINSTSAAGVISSPADRISPLSAVQLPGTIPGETDIWVQYKAWDSSFGSDWVAGSQAAGKFYGVSNIRNILGLGPATGPGIASWQSAAGSSLTAVNAFGLTPNAIVPEPSTMALAGMGIASLLIFRRRK